jgi:hypothetical protein
VLGALSEEQLHALTLDKRVKWTRHVDLLRDAEGSFLFDDSAHEQRVYDMRFDRED